MIIFKDAISGVEVFSDSYKVTPSEDGFLLVCEGKHTQMKLGGGIDAGLIGGNPSQEEGGGDDVDDSEQVKSGVDVVMHYNLQDLELSKKDLKDYLKRWAKRRVACEDMKQNDEKKKAFTCACGKNIASFLKLMTDDAVVLAGDGDFIFEEGNQAPIIGVYAENGMDMKLYAIAESLIEEKQ
ncbi:tRNA 2'-phosphotransferase [Mactra antiquata]